MWWRLRARSRDKSDGVLAGKLDAEGTPTTVFTSDDDQSLEGNLEDSPKHDNLADDIVKINLPNGDGDATASFEFSEGLDLDAMRADSGPANVENVKLNISTAGIDGADESSEDDYTSREGRILHRILTNATLDVDDDDRRQLLDIYGEDDRFIIYDWLAELILQEFLQGRLRRMFQTYNSLWNLARVVKPYLERLLELEEREFTDEHKEALNQLARTFNKQRRSLRTPSQNAALELRPLLVNFFCNHLNDPRTAITKFYHEITRLTQVETPPKMRIVMLIVGSRGDVQPFIALAKRLQSEYGHKVRIATHSVFKDWVQSHGVEFFDLPGDPKALIDIMVKHDLLSPGMAVEGFKTKRPWLKELFPAAYQSCVTPSPGETYYRADVIIANPPSFAGPHVAWKLGIPCHMAFTMPWTPTRFMQSPFITTTFFKTGQARYLTYRGVDLAIWAGTGDIVQHWRSKDLGLPRIRRGHRLLRDKHIPFTYCFSEALIPRPADWPPQCSVSGFWFLDNPDTGFVAGPELENFLKAGPAPVFIGFGSIVVDDPDTLTNTIIEAVQKSGQRAIIQKGWAGMEAPTVSDDILFIGGAPHDWLFPQCAAVVHHGGAGTTAAGLRAGKPTVVVPFFGDQFFWGQMVAETGAGPKPVPYLELTVAILAQAITTACEQPCIDKAAELGQRVNAEDGVGNAIKHFHSVLPLSRMTCDMDPCRSGAVAVVYNKTLEKQLCRECDAHHVQSGEDGASERYIYNYIDWAQTFYKGTIGSHSNLIKLDDGVLAPY